MNENVKNMAKAIIPVYVDWKIQEDFSGKKTIDLATTIATALDKAGYRKQSDTVKEFAEKAIENIEKMDNPEHWDEARLGFESAREHSVSKIEALAEQYGKEEKE